MIKIEKDFKQIDMYKCAKKFVYVNSHNYIKFFFFEVLFYIYYYKKINDSMFACETLYFDQPILFGSIDDARKHFR